MSDPQNHQPDEQPHVGAKPAELVVDNAEAEPSLQLPPPPAIGDATNADSDYEFGLEGNPPANTASTASTASTAPTATAATAAATAEVTSAENGVQQSHLASNNGKSNSAAADTKSPDEPGHIMTVIEHLDELRWRIIRSLGALVVAMGAALIVGKEAVRILEAPAGGIQFQALSLEEPLIVYFKVSFYLAIILACPWILFEVCQFIAPGLRQNERRILSPIVFGSPMLFVAGAAFAYYCVLPPMLHFFNSFGQGMSPIHQRLDFYISLVSSIMMYMGLCFQLPIIIFALALAGLVNSTQLIRFWRYAVFGASVVALIITPDPTAFSMLIVMGALIGLYFLSVALLKLFGK